MIETMIKESIKGLKEYNPNNYDCKYKLDANESPFNMPQRVIDSVTERLKSMPFNRYPDPQAIKLKQYIAAYNDMKEENIIVGNGSDEMIGMIVNTFVDKGEVVLTHSPTFPMYRIYSIISDARYEEIPSSVDFKVDIDKLIFKARDIQAKIIFLCNPNNPTGNIIEKRDILRLVKEIKSIVVVDEAYIEFGGQTVIEEINNYPNLIVLRTLSKAFGCAGIRLGYMAASSEIIKLLNKSKPPYNLNSMSQIAGEEIMKHFDDIGKIARYIVEQRKDLYKKLQKINSIHPYPSHGNFILIKVGNGDRIFKRLLKHNILIRNYTQGVLKDYIRVTVGTSSDNDYFIKVLKEVVEN